MAFEQPLPKSLSPSRLADFQTCPRRYQHASVERIPQPASYATAKGRFVRHLLEATDPGIGAARGFSWEGWQSELSAPDLVVVRAPD